MGKLKKKEVSDGKKFRQVTYNELMVLLVLDYKVVSMDYFMDKLQPYELAPLLDNLQLSVKEDWEQTREICYIVAATHSTKRMKPSDLMKFSWEQKKETVSIDKKKVMALANKMIKATQK